MPLLYINTVYVLYQSIYDVRCANHVSTGNSKAIFHDDEACNRHSLIFAMRVSRFLGQLFSVSLWRFVGARRV